jgi:hypothetical protein
MSGYLSATHWRPIERLNPGAPSRESQRSMPLFRAPTRKSIEPSGTSNRRHSHIHILNNDILLNIFDLYRLNIENGEYLYGAMIIRSWDRQRWWYKLAQVSRRWRYLILASPIQLNLRLLCTYGVPVADMLAHSPPLPLIIFYYDHFRKISTEDEEGALLALSHRDRVCRIALRMPAPKLGKFITAIDEQFPILDRLYIKSQTEEETSLILPQTLQAPNLRHIHLWYAALPIGSPVLTSTGGLVVLWLDGIPRSAFFPPSYILARLSLMPQLEELGIRFHFPLPNHNVVRQVLNTSITTHVTLPNLHRFSFRGFSAYLEGLLARITAPVLSTLQVDFFNQLTLTVPRLLQFMQTSENLISKVVRLVFYDFSVRLMGDLHQLRMLPALNLGIMCRHLDWQVASAAQILDALSPVLSAVEELKLEHWEHSQSSEWHNEVDRAQWRKLLRPFSNVKTLRVPKALVGELSRSLRSEDGEMPLELLPNLLELQSSGGSSTGDAFAPFTNERQIAGHPVRLVT